MHRYRRPLESLIAALVVHAAVFAVLWVVHDRAPEPEDWHDRSPRMEFTVRTTDVPEVAAAAVAEPPRPAAEAAAPAQSAAPPPPADAASDTDALSVRADAASDTDALAVRADAASDTDASAVRADAASDTDALSVRADAASDTDALAVRADAASDTDASAVRADAASDTDALAVRADAASDTDALAVRADVPGAPSSSAVGEPRPSDAETPRAAADVPPSSADPAPGAPFAPTPRKITDRSLLARVLRGSGRTRMPEGFVKAGKAPTGPLPSDEERAAAGASKWATVAPRPRQSRVKKLVPGKEGGYRYVDADTGEVIPDDAPAPVGDTLGPRMADNQRAGGWGYQDRPWGTRPFKQKEHDDLQPTDDGGYAFEASGFSAKINRDGSVVFDENLASIKPGKTAPIWEESGLPLAEYSADYSTFSFDATDALMRLAGKDPYVTAKLRFLDDTRGLREDMRANHRVAKVELALVGLRRELDAAWHNVRRTGPQRRRVIFEMWDDCSDGPEGTIARDFIITFVNAHLPASSEHAYTPAELEMFNRERASGPPFSPYA